MKKRCYICRTEKPLTEFGISTHYKNIGLCDSRSVYCKPCNAERVRQGRLRELQRKPFVLSPCDKVMRAVRNGHRTREQIRRSAKLQWDDTMDAIAELALVQRVLFSKRINGEAYFYLVGSKAA